MSEKDDFAEIRPYQDNEVEATLERLLSSPELLTFLSRYQFPWVYRLMPNIAMKLVSKHLRKKLSDVDTVATFQQMLSQYVNAAVDKTISHFVCEGLEQLPSDKSYLFLCNHRDIAMDPALVNYALYQQGSDTSRIAIGDNLLNQGYVEDLMRLNKSFIVKRSVQGRREKMHAFQTLSRYIAHSVYNGTSVWLAQREGRAKDGIDKTDSAIIKMLYMQAKQQKISFEDFIQTLNVVPVCISYELDPCDIYKARELDARASDQEYDKGEDEDLRSIVTGIKGNKGRVTVRFGQLLDQSYANANEVAEEIDRQIHQMYELYPINYAALSRINTVDEGIIRHPEVSQAISQITDNDQSLLDSRLADLNDTQREFLLSMYAAPVISRFK